MYRQQSGFREQLLPEIDHRAATWQAYLNCLLAFQGIDMTSGMVGSGEPLSISRTSQERFCYHLGVLDGMVDQDKDDEFKKKPDGTAYEFQDIPSLMRKYPADEIGRVKGFDHYFEYWYRLDKMLRRNGIFTTTKIPHARL